jgi:very-short-patch-repair endonuclease
MVELARQFRRESTPSEAVLWQAVRGRKLEGIKFRREQPIGPFVVDFFAASERLIVEVDGPIHESQVEADARRQGLLEELGFRFVRIQSEVVERDLATALEMIRAGIFRGRQVVERGQGEPSPPQPPSPKGGEGGVGV